jgi:hypothetical protein
MLVAFSADEYNKGNKYISQVGNLNLPYAIDTMLIDASKDKPSASKL